MKHTQKQATPSLKKFLLSESLIKSKELTPKQLSLIMSYIHHTQLQALSLVVALAEKHLLPPKTDTPLALTSKTYLNRVILGSVLENVSLRDLVRFSSQLTKYRLRTGSYPPSLMTVGEAIRDFVNSEEELTDIND